MTENGNINGDGEVVRPKKKWITPVIEYFDAQSNGSENTSTLIGSRSDIIVEISKSNRSSCESFSIQRVSRCYSKGFKVLFNEGINKFLELNQNFETGEKFSWGKIFHRTKITKFSPGDENFFRRKI